MSPPTDDAAGDWWLIGAGLAIAQLARSGRGFTAEHVTDLVGEPADPHYVGASFASAYRKGLIEPVGARIGRNGPCRVWWGTPDARY